MGRRWLITDFQRVVLYVALAAAVFLMASALGAWTLWPLLAGLALFGGTFGSVAALQMRRAAAQPEIASAAILWVQDPPLNADLQAPCDMRLAIRLPTGVVRTRYRDPAMPLTQWPAKGQVVPVEIRGGRLDRHMKIRWDLQGRSAQSVTVSASDSSSTVTPMWEDEHASMPFTPTPPRPRRPPRPTATPEAEQLMWPSARGGAESAVDESGVRLFEDFDDEYLDDSLVRTPPIPTGRDYTGDRDYTDGPDYRDFTARPEAAFGAYDDFGSEFYSAEPATAVPATEIPRPRPPEPATFAEPADDPGRGGSDLDASLPVADLARSLRFYRDDLGFTVAYVSSDSAVVEAGGLRILLEQTTNPARRGGIRLRVEDVEATYTALRSRGVSFAQGPGLEEGAQARRARLLDPDGHEIDLVEWR